MKSSALLPRFWLVALAILCLGGTLLAEETGLSHVRVVRLSYVSGTVAVKRPGATDWAKALVNTPIVEGYSLSTGANSYAEVEFENGSTARLGEQSLIDFSQLALNAEGHKLNKMAFEQGYATFHFVPERGDVYSVTAGDTTLTPGGKTEFRTNLIKDHLRVEVFDGSVNVAAPSGTAKLGKDKTLNYTAQSNEAFNIHSGIQKDSWDQWAQARDRQTVLAKNDSPMSMNGSLYGWSDLDAYGDWAFFPGYGYGWAPFAPMGWMPYSMGMWSWYPSFGWTWISGDPWGWVPYHYGFWNYDPMFGWFWMPDTFSMWSPALVSWYMGPTWVGWAPRGTAGQCNCVASVPPGTVQGGKLISNTGMTVTQPNQGKMMKQFSLQPEATARLSGVPLEGSALLTTRTSGTANFSTRTFSAPSSVLMGQSTQAEIASTKERGGFWSHLTGSNKAEPMRVRMGNTLGGHFPVTGRAAESNEVEIRPGSVKTQGRMAGHSAAPSRGVDRAASRPVFLPHGSEGRAAVRGEGGFEGASRAGGVSSGVSSAASSSSQVSVAPAPRASSGGGHDRH